MKILHRSKRALPPLPQVAELINTLSETPDEDLADVLGAIDHWRWPRSDLNAWINVLNKLDAILEKNIRDYAVDVLQRTPFAPQDKRAICEILRFERLLLENSTNRKTFASYDRINSFLSTSDLDVLVLALNLLLRPAQQYSAQPSVSRALSISTPRLLALAKRWSHMREYGVSLLDLVVDNTANSIDALPNDAREFQFSFYKPEKTDQSTNKDPSKVMDVDTDAQPSSDVPKTPVRRGTAGSSTSAPTTSATGATSIFVDQAMLSDKSTMDVIASVQEHYELSDDDKFDLMCRVRVAQSLLPGHAADREKLLTARLIAIAIFIHTHTEQVTSASLFLYEPDLTTHIAELLSLERVSPIGVQTAAIAALDAMARYRSRVQDVLTTVNAGVNHGTLMALFRKTVADVAHEDCSTPHSFVEALLSFVTFLASHASGGTMIVGAGLVPLLIQIIENRLPQRLPMVSKAMQLVDNVLYSFANAFQLFCNNRGVDVLVERIAFEINEDIRLHSHEEKNADAPRSYGLLPVVRSAALKHILRSMHRMMQSSGNSEGLRGLIDSSLLQSIKRVMEHRALFGPNVLPIAINIMATFVHNEPTSLSIIQEARVPETFYKTIDAGLEPVIEVIQAIPNAIGALCLNQVGQDQLVARPTIIPGFFTIFTSERHQRVLQDKENAVLIGTAVDELIRHHPMLKSAVFDAIRVTLSKIENLGQGYEPPQSIRSNYELVRPQDVAPEPARDEVTMDTSDSDTSPQAAQPAVDQDKTADEDSGRKSENTIVLYLDVVCRFLEGLFQHPQHCKDFLNNYGALEQIGRLTALPCLPYEFGNSVASDSLVQVVRTMFDASPNVTMGALCELVKASLGDTSEFWSEIKPGSRLLALLDPNVYSESLAREAFRRLVTLHVRVMLLSDVYATVGYSHGRSIIGLLHILMGRGAPEVIPELGELHRAMIWESVQIKSTPSPVSDQQPPQQSTANEGSTSASHDPATLLGEPSAPVNMQNGGQESTSPTPTPAPNQDGTTGEDRKEDEPGMRAIRHLITSIPNALTPFFQSIVKLFSTKRHPDEAQRQAIKDAASRLSNVLLRHLELIEIGTDRLVLLQYYTSILSLITTLLTEERNATSTLYTVLLNTFYQNDGMDALLAVCRCFMSAIEDITSTSKESRTETQTLELNSAFGGLKVSLALIHPIVSTKAIFESPQTGLLIEREKRDGDPGYFEPHNFLVRMRLVMLPCVRELWSSGWLASAPSGLVRSVVQVVLEIVNAEGEEGTQAQVDIPTIGGGAASLFRTTVPDEARITQITDMGFPRWAAERALQRTQNNVNAATELLLSNPYRFHPGAPPPGGEADGAPAQENAPEAEGEANDQAMDEDESADDSPGAEGTNDEATPTDETTAPVPVNEDSAPAEPPVPVKTSAQWRESLNEAREPLRDNIGSLALRLVDEHPDLIFDVQSAFVGKVEGYQKESIRLLTRNIREFSAHAIDSQEQQLAVRCRLLAIVLNEAPSSFVSVITGEEKGFMDGLLALVLSAPINAEADRSTTPKWLAALLLVAESLLTLGEEPRSVPSPKEGESIQDHELLSGPAYPEARARLFDFVLRVLALPSLPRDDLISALRLLVLLTRNHSVALDFVKREGVPLLFKSLKSSRGGIAGCQSYITIILRHVVEDSPTLRAIMKQEVQRVMTSSRQRPMDITTYVRTCHAMALRDPSAFLDATESIARLERPYGTPAQILLKDSTRPKSTNADAPVDVTVTATAAGAEGTSQAISSALPEYLESVVHYLITELVKSVKPAAFEPSSTSSPQATFSTPSSLAAPKDKPATGASPGDAATDSQSDDDFYYRTFVMQSLTELLFSYDACKLAFLSYSPKKRPTNAPKESSGKFRTFALHFLLNELITYGALNPEPKEASERKRILFCNWAMSITVALCVDTSASQDVKDVSPELVHVRKFVLEAVSRAIKDPAPTESLGGHYGRLLALADLCYRLLTVRYSVAPRKSAQDDSPPTHIAKIMLEKNFVSTLTSTLAEADLNFPNIRGLVQAVLKPLELLSKIAIKMSRASDKTKGSELKDNTDESDELSEDGDEDEDDVLEDDVPSDREETPDLYRNSSLGMFTGAMDDQFAEEAEMEGEEGEDEEDVEMDFGEESDGTSEESDVVADVEMEEDLEEDGSGDEEDWEGEEEDEGDDLVEEEGESVPEMDDNVDGEQDEDEQWEDIDEGDQIAGIMDQADEAAEDMDELAMYGHEDEDDGAMGSDDELDPELGLLEAAEAGGQDDVFRVENALGDRLANFVTHGTGNIIVTGGLPVPVMHDANGVDMFGQARAAQPAPDTVTHPLLLEGSASERSGAHGRSSRRNRVNQVLGGTLNGPQDILAAIENVIGGPAVQLFQTIFSRRGPGGAEAIRLDVPHGPLFERHNLIPINRRTGAIPPSLQIQGRSSRGGEQRSETREFDPYVTVQRWGEEVKIIHGKFANDRFSKLGNHVVTRLLPEAIKRDEEQKKVAEREQELARQAEVRAKEEAETKAREEKAAADAAAAAEAEAAAAAAAASVTTEETTGEGEPAAPEHPNDDAEMVDSADQESPTEAAAEPSQGDNAGEPSSSTAPERVTVLIHGNPVDITDTGIDPTFLEALPDEMREEVVNQHIRDQHAARVERPADSQISAEFLDALPPDIRAEIIQQERVEQARRRAEEQGAQSTQGGGAEIDPATFIASLDPQLRQDVLMDQDDGFIQTLPSHMIAEAGMYREHNPPPSFPVPRFAPATSQPVPAPRKATATRDAIQLLDKSGIAVLIRLLFFPQILRKSVLFKILVNLCENSKTRTDLFNLFLNILQDGATDLSAIDRSFAQLTFRNLKTPTQTPRAAGKQKAGPEYFSNPFPPSQLPNEIVPDLLAQRCLEALSYIVSSNEHFSLFYLTEHELPVGFKRGNTKKSKGKEKQPSQTQYPLVLLLNLLDRQSLLKTPPILESLVGLLDTVTRPLTSLKDPRDVNDEPSAEKPTSVATTSDPAPAEAASTPSIVNAPAQADSSSAAPGPSQAVDPPKDEKTVEEKILLANPPQIPHAVLRLIVNILTVGECGAKPFHHSLALIQHLSYIPDAREVIANELRAKTQILGQSLHQDLDELARALGSDDADVMASSVASKFSSPSSDQAKLLRVLKTIDYMYSSKAGTSEPQPSTDVEKIQSIYESFKFTPLWRKLGDCLSIIEQRPEMEHIATVLLPLIESLMVVCKYVGSTTSMGAAARALRSSASPKSPSSARESMEDLFVTFTDAHRKVLNVMVRNNPSLMSGSFSLLVNNPRVLDFDNKRNYFSQQLHRRPHREHYATLQLNVRRQRVFEDSFQHLQRKTGDQIKYGKLSVRFYAEEGVDAGGVTREWFQILARQMFDPNNALFEPCAADRLTYQPNKASWVNPEHLSFFKFVGRVIGKAIYDGRLLEAYFARSLYRQILGKPVDYRDVEWIDPDYYKSLCWILENDPSSLDLNFSIEGDEFGVMKIVDLKENGSKIPVTLENRREFVQLSAQYRLYESIKDQLESLLSGFYEIIPKELVAIFNEQELELLISGTPDIDVDEWRSATEYNGYTSSDPVIVWWWRALKSFGRDERAKVLSFATGTSRVPLNGFSDLQGVQGTQRFSIHRAYGDTNRLPQAHTCFNQIDLPQYSSYEMLRQQLLLAINEGGEGFGFA